MTIRVYKTDSIDQQASIAVLASKESVFDASFLSEKEFNYVKLKIDKGDTFISINQYNRLVFIAVIDKQKPLSILLEEARKAGYKVQASLNDCKFKNINIFHAENNAEALLAFTEGILLGSYKFIKYFKNQEDKKPSLEEVGVICQPLSQKAIDELVNVSSALCEVRNLVNEPVSSLNAEQLALAIDGLCKTNGCTVEIFNKNKIEALKMGGLLAVNKGSIDPPTFTIVEWKPENPINNKPYVLVGKGIVYDTGGLSLKPTSDSMDYMKCDMSGAAIVAGVLAAIAANKLPLHIVALIPATDNRPSGNAYAPGDVIHIMDGTTVENLNSDAEGRLILADALIYAKKYDPELVIDVATLTGAASVAIGPYALVALGTASKEVKEKLNESGEYVFERIVEFPLWDDYAELIKSDIADLKNVGGKNAGAITAAKFLEHFTTYPWMHFDIAGVAFSKKNDNYRGKGGTGFGMRLLYDFFKRKTL
jgi:leucyl aminopeptidase